MADVYGGKKLCLKKTQLVSTMVLHIFGGALDQESSYADNSTILFYFFYQVILSISYLYIYVLKIIISSA